MSTGEIALNKNMNEILQDKVRTLIVDLLPDEAIQGLIQREFQAFFQPQQKPYGKEEPSRFHSLVSEIVSKEVNALISSLVREKFNNMITTHKDGPDGWVREYTNEVYKEVTPAIMEAMMRHMATNVINSVRNANGY